MTKGTIACYINYNILGSPLNTKHNQSRFIYLLNVENEGTLPLMGGVPFLMPSYGVSYMPMPKPKASETREAFLDRFMSNPKMKEEYPDETRRLAIASSLYEAYEEAQEDEKYKKKKDEYTQATSRIDYYDMPMDDASFKRTEEGYLKGIAPVTNIGVFTYSNPDGSLRRELRLPEEVMDEKSLKTLKLAPLTFSHPAEEVTSENIKQYQIGHLGDGVYNDAFRVYAPIVITDAESVDKVKMGTRALSCGYTVDLEMKNGTWMGVDYDAIQRNIRYNHVAVVERGRAGDDAVMKLDNARVDAISRPVENTTKHRRDSSMEKTIKLDGVEYKAEAKVIEVLTQTQSKLDSVAGELESAKKEHSALQAKVDSLTESNEELKSKADEAAKVQPEVIEQAVQKRIAVLGAAKKAGVEYKGDEAEVDLKKQVILSAFPKANLDEKDEVYIDARFDAALEIIQEREEVENKNKQDAAEGTETPAQTSEVKADEARQKMIDGLANAWKKGA